MGTPRVAYASEGRALNVVGDTIWIRLKGHEAGCSFSLIEGATPPQGGPPRHVHQREDEGFYVLEGEFEFRVGDRVIQATPGTFLFGPRAIPHSFKNIGTKTARVLIVISPPGFEKFFEEADLLGKAGPPPMERLVELARKYALEFLSPGLRNKENLMAEL